jgi:hypothetical protein
MVLTPKKDFQDKKQFAEAHRELVVSTQFREALQAALVDHVLSLPTIADSSAAAAAYHQIVGAREFITRLLNVAETPKAPPTPLPTNLNHEVK